MANTKNYKKQGGDEWVIGEGGKLTGEIQEIPVEMVTTADVVDKIAFIANEDYEVVGVKEVHSTAESTNAPNLQVERLQNTESLGNGDALLTNNSNSGFDLTSTANTVVDGSLVSDGTQKLNAGDRLGLVVSGSTAEIAGVCVTIQVKRI